MFHLAEFNIARMKASLDDPLMAEFVRLLADVNAAADSSPGFIWRLQTDEGDATGIHAYDDPLMLVNLSVWETVESLKEYTYRSLHATPFRKRKEWFEPFDGPSLVLWWIPKGKIPTVEEGRDKLNQLTTYGPTAEAFSFKQTFRVIQTSS